MVKPTRNEELELINKIELCASEILCACTDDYASRIWALIRNDVINDVLECTDGEDGFTRGGVCLAIGRALLEGLSSEA